MSVSAPAHEVGRPEIAFECDLDYRQQITARADRVRWLVIPKRRYLAIEGRATPGEPGFRDAISTLYPVAYTLHFALKRKGIQAPVGALEGLYWIGDPGPISAAQFTAGSDLRDQWTWRLMMPVPDEASDADCRAAVEAAAAKQRPPLLDQLRCEPWQEGAVGQLMHIGPYDAEAPTIERLQKSITDAGLRARGCHHEIYVGDPNRTAPDKLKTLIRQPVDAIS